MSSLLITDEVEVGFTPQEYTVSEGLNTAVTFCVSLNGLLQRNGVTVRVTTSDITAMSKLPVYVPRLQPVIIPLQVDLITQVSTRPSSLILGTSKCVWT